MIDNSKEYILCAAVKRLDGGFDCGYRHNDVYEKVDQEDVLTVYETDFFTGMGFLTSKKRFVDRYEAKNIALECGQVKERKFNEELNKLFGTETRNWLASEDLY